VRITLIAAVAKNGVIGRGGQLAWHLPDDLAHFKALTVGKPVVMGRKTYESIGKPLPRRVNLVMTRTLDAIEGCRIVRSVDEAIAAAGDVPELCVIGGEAVYAAFLPRADVLELTHVDAHVPGDARFPDFDRAAFARVSADTHPPDDRHAYAFEMVRYERR
jgi:dihydrofolate reductase